MYLCVPPSPVGSWSPKTANRFCQVVILKIFSRAKQNVWKNNCEGALAQYFLLKFSVILVPLGFSSCSEQKPQIFMLMVPQANSKRRGEKTAREKKGKREAGECPYSFLQESHHPIPLFSCGLLIFCFPVALIGLVFRFHCFILPPV